MCICICICICICLPNIIGLMVSWNFCGCFDLLLAGLGIFKNDTDNKVVGSDANF